MEWGRGYVSRTHTGSWTKYPLSVHYHISSDHCIRCRLHFYHSNNIAPSICFPCPHSDSLTHTTDCHHSTTINLYLHVLLQWIHPLPTSLGNKRIFFSRMHPSLPYSYLLYRIKPPSQPSYSTRNNVFARKIPLPLLDSPNLTSHYRPY